MKEQSVLRSALALATLVTATLCIAPRAGAAEYTVEMTYDWEFSPKYLEIQVGDLVTWVNHDYSYYLHDSYCPGYWYSGYLDVDESWSLQFPITGTFNYRDSQFYIMGMTGTIVVHPATTPTTPAPVLVDPARVSNGGFQFTVSNLVAGSTYVIQASSDLQNWSDLSTNLAASTAETYLDSSAATISRRFYRVVVR